MMMPMCSRGDGVDSCGSSDDGVSVALMVVVVLVVVVTAVATQKAIVNCWESVVF